MDELLPYGTGRFDTLCIKSVDPQTRSGHIAAFQTTEYILTGPGSLSLPAI